MALKDRVFVYYPVFFISKTNASIHKQCQSVILCESISSKLVTDDIDFNGVIN
jgi:hypothetical protein